MATLKTLTLEIRLHHFDSPDWTESVYGQIATGGAVELVDLGNQIEHALPGPKSEELPRMRIVDDEGNELGAWF